MPGANEAYGTNQGQSMMSVNLSQEESARGKQQFDYGAPAVNFAYGAPNVNLANNVNSMEQTRNQMNLSQMPLNQQMPG